MRLINRTIRALSVCAICVSSLLALSVPAQAMNINLSYDSSVSSAPSGFKSAMNTVASALDSYFTNPIDININVGWGEVNGTALPSNDAGESIGLYYTKVSYLPIAQDLYLTDSAAGNSGVAQQAAQYIPGTSPIVNSLSITSAEAKAIGAAANSSAVDGYVGFSASLPYAFNTTGSTPSGKYDFLGLAYHEVTEIMGRTGFLPNTAGSGTVQTPLDLFRYTSSGTLDTASPNSKNYFSVNDGATAINYYNTVAGADYADWASGYGADALNAYIDPAGVTSPFSVGDLELMNVLGYQTSAAAYSSFASVPEPSVLLLLGLGAGACLFGKRRRGLTLAWM